MHNFCALAMEVRAKKLSIEGYVEPFGKLKTTNVLDWLLGNSLAECAWHGNLQAAPSCILNTTNILKLCSYTENGQGLSSD